MKLTRELILDGKTQRGGWTKQQLALLGVHWPLQTGWIERLVGTDVDDTTYQAFLNAAQSGCKRTQRKNAQCTAAPKIKRNMPFGKHRGTPLAEVPRDYLEWLLRECDLEVDLTADVWAVLNPTVDTWNELQRMVAKHAESYKTFDTERFMKETRRMGVRWARFVIVRGIELANKIYRNRRRESSRVHGKMDLMETELDRRIARDPD